VLVIGAGEMAEESLRYLRDEGVKDVVVVNRNRERAESLASQFGGRADDFENLDVWLAKADLIVSTTGATQTVVDHERFATIRKSSERKPVVILDLGAPRDFAPSIAKIDENVFLIDIDRLEGHCEENRQLRKAEIKQARKIIQEQTQRFMHEVYHRATGPVIQRLREQMGEISRSELEILYRKNPDLSETQRAAVEKTVHRIVNKLLHPPLETLKDEAKAGTPHGLLDAIKRLFNLGD
jgi:glutamyl-tRNA reductase